MNVRELQKKAKEISKENPNEALDILIQALKLEPITNIQFRFMAEH